MHLSAGHNPIQLSFKRDTSEYGRTHWDGHGGPVLFYENTIADPNLAEAQGHGWKHSLAYNDIRAIEVLPEGIDFGEVYPGESVSKAIRLRNSGRSPIPTISVTVSNPFQSLSRLVENLQPDADNSFLVSFNPEITGRYATTLVLSGDFTDSPVSIPLVGVCDRTPGEPESLGIQWVGNPNFIDRREGQIIDSIVIHTTEGPTAQSAVDTLLQRGLSAHYVIAPYGEIYQLVELSKRASHATYYNDRSIGIEMVGFANESSTWNARNLAALEDLVVYLVKKFETIPVVHPSGDACSYRMVGSTKLD